MRLIPIGRVLSTHGIRGEVRFRYYNEVKEDFTSYISLFAEHNEQQVELKLAGARTHGKAFLLSFQGYSSVEDVSFLRNRELFVREGDLPALPEGVYYDYQLVGMRVIDANGRSLGTVTEVVHSGGPDILALDGAEEQFVLLADDRIAEINLGEGFIRTAA